MTKSKVNQTVIQSKLNTYSVGEHIPYAFMSITIHETFFLHLAERPASTTAEKEQLSKKSVSFQKNGKFPKN